MALVANPSSHSASHRLFPKILFPFALLESLYCAFVHSIVEYGSVLWDPNTSAVRDMTRAEGVLSDGFLQARYSYQNCFPVKSIASICLYNSWTLISEFLLATPPVRLFPFASFAFPFNCLKTIGRSVFPDLFVTIAFLLRCTALVCKSSHLARAQ